MWFYLVLSFCPCFLVNDSDFLSSIFIWNKFCKRKSWIQCSKIPNRNEYKNCVFYIVNNVLKQDETIFEKNKHFYCLVVILTIYTTIFLLKLIVHSVAKRKNKITNKYFLVFWYFFLKFLMRSRFCTNKFSTNNYLISLTS